MADITYTRLFPDRVESAARALLASLTLEHTAAIDRPYTLVNFIASVDGRITIGGRSGGLGDGGDLELFRSLRERADAVLAGTGTMATERYGRILAQPERREWRRSRGLAAEPLACLVSRSGRLPLEIPLFAEPAARVVVFSPHPPDLSGVAAQISHEPLGDGPSALGDALRTLRARHGVRTLLCEGGPTLFRALLRERLADELYLTLAPKLADGAGAGSIVKGGHGTSEGEAIDLRLLTVLERRGAIYLRYGIGG